MAQYKHLTIYEATFELLHKKVIFANIAFNDILTWRGTMKRLIALFLIYIVVPCIVVAAEVKNLKVGQSGDNAVATYDLVGGAGEQDAEVTVVITIGNERRTSEKLSLTGDFGKGVKVGTGKKIVWNVLKDFPAGPHGDLRWDVKVAAGKSYKDPSLGMEFVNIQGGCYQMGDTFGDGQRDEKPVHEVCVNDFALAKYDVTVGEFRKFVVATGYKTEAEIDRRGCYVPNGNKAEFDDSKNWRDPGFNQDDSNPVVCVSWNDAGVFINWLSEVSGTQYRFPTEAEWEYAARSGGKAEKYAGGNDINAVAWYSDNSGGTAHKVGTKQPNGLGLYDMSGNVCQWVQDWYGWDYYRDSLRSNPQGPGSGQSRVLRGSSWGNIASNSRASLRDGFAPGYRSSGNGFRLARTP